MWGSLLGLVWALGAAPSEDAVSWQAPPSCPDAAVVRGRIEELLRRPLGVDEVRIEAVVRAEGEGFVLALRVIAGEVVDERELAAERCAALADTAALLAAVMVDPDVADTLLVPEPDVAEPEPEVELPSAEPEPEPKPEPPSAEEPEPESLPARPEPEPGSDRSIPETARPTTLPRGPSAWLRAQAGGEYGAIPGGTGGAAVTIAIGGASVRGELSGQYWIGRQAQSPHASARVHLGHVAGRACRLLPARPLAAALCGGIELGVMRGDALAPASLTRLRPWLAAQAEVALRWQPRPRVALWVGAQPFVPLVFPRFELVDSTAPTTTELIHVPTSVGIRGLVGVELRAWPGRS
ncbi:hypothetical protein [Paraliomyxa miuraensis]|uniref:hypothetical protein n=1 Tax=Paraliomyxa miuraensis TaxID=376150 RepID=UPI00225632F5|nr:hypothetical protein [Paraliomyxa miuraensis]MCX4242691.1 hypothetical protein [Paraliomyxa miuraensis]